MLIFKIGHISRDMARAEPEARWVFGDNAARMGKGGLAKELRGEPNAIGVATKHYPSSMSWAYFTDNNQCLKIVIDDLMKVHEALVEGRIVYYPKAGIGTGMAELGKRAPKLNKFINEWFASRVGQTHLH